MHTRETFVCCFNTYWSLWPLGGSVPCWALAMPQSVVLGTDWFVPCQLGLCFPPIGKLRTDLTDRLCIAFMFTLAWKSKVSPPNACLVIPSHFLGIKPYFLGHRMAWNVPCQARNTPMTINSTEHRDCINLPKVSVPCNWLVIGAASRYGADLCVTPL